MIDLDLHLPALAHGDADAFERWVAGAEDTLRASLRSFAAAVDTEAILQEALLRVWQVAPRFVADGKPNGLVRLGIRIARNLAVSEWRRTRPTAEISALEGGDPALAEMPRAPDPLLRQRDPRVPGEAARQAAAGAGGAARGGRRDRRPTRRWRPTSRCRKIHFFRTSPARASSSASASAATGSTSTRCSHDRSARTPPPPPPPEDDPLVESGRCGAYRPRRSARRGRLSFPRGTTLTQRVVSGPSRWPARCEVSRLPADPGGRVVDRASAVLARVRAGRRLTAVRLPDGTEHARRAFKWQASRRKSGSQRVDLAAAYRLVAHFGWDDLIFTHLTARVPGPEHQFLINPYGMLFEEITASSLVKVDLAGKKVSESPYDINPAGYVIHSSIHAAREDAQSVMHVHSVHGVAISAQKNGVLPISQQSTFVLSSLAYHDYEGVALRDEEKPRLVRDLGDKTYLMLRNHGLLTVGPTVAETFLALYLFDFTCRIQVAAQAGSKELIPIEGSILATADAQKQAAMKNGGGALAWPALLRKLDRMDPSFRE